MKLKENCPAAAQRSEGCASAVRCSVLDRQKVEAILIRRFPGATHHQVAAAANAIMGLEEEWEEIVGEPYSLPREVDLGWEFRLFRRREV